ncbi:diguanylate cyclase [Celeribacter arenosi]
MAGSILIADKVPTNRIILKVKLSSAYYSVLQCDTGARTLEIARRERPNLILMDLDLGDMTAFETCRALKDDPQTAHIPVAIITLQGDTEAKIAALKAGADEFLTKPLDELTLTARVRALMRASATSDELRRRQETATALGFAEAPALFEACGKIALVGSTIEEARSWRAGLKGLVGHEIIVQPAQTLLEAISQDQIADLYVISASHNATSDGLRRVADLRSRAGTRHAGIVVVHDANERREAHMALDLGANDIITRGSDPEELALRLRTQMRRKQEADRLRDTMEVGLKLAAIDSLTGLYNRRYALPHVEKIAAEATTNNTPFALMLIDIDRFKAVNDTYGHATGDAVLVTVAKRLRANLRGMDLIARFGGEEFLVCLPATSLVEARACAERLREAICDEVAAEAPNGDPICVSVSIGMTMGGGVDGAPVAPLDALIDIADRALYDSKAEGRNLVTLGSHAA